MSEAAPPPAYSAVGSGENIPPPSYNQEAPTAPPSYNPSAPSSAPVTQSQPGGVKYVDQHGNPVNPPNANIKYVDQNGNPVNPPPQAQVSQQPAIKYVDQYGNPVNPPPKANVKYVDQYGNPVAAPKTAPVVQQPAANVKYVDQYGNPVNAPPQANVKYVDQYGNPVAAPKTAVQQPAANVKYVDQYGNPVNPPTTATTTTNPNAGVVVSPGAQTKTAIPQSIKQQKTAAAILGGIAALILFIGLCVDSLATGEEWDSSSFDYIRYTCGWTEISVDCPYDFSSSCTDTSTSYGDFCDAENTLEDTYGTDVSPSWCGTKASAALSLVCMLFSTIACFVAVIFVQPWCKVEQCCCKTNPNCGCARILFIFSLMLGILTMIIWLAGDDICLGSGEGNIDMGIGGSIICDIIGMIFLIICASLAK